MHLPRTLVRTLSGVAAVVSLAGCDGGGEAEDRGRTVTVGPTDAVDVVADEYLFDPSTIVAGDGGELELTLDNQGAIAHNLRLFDGEEDVGGTPTFAGGEARTVRLELDRGSYRMVCTVGDHEELGMVGDLEVR